MSIVRIPLSSRKFPGLFAIVDESDYATVSQYTWSVWRAKSGRLFYPRTHVWRPNGRRCGQVMHRLILGITDRDVFVDHINGDGLDNRRSNLRIATKTQNQCNRGPVANRSSRFKGVCWDRQNGKWLAYIGVNNKSHHLGRFHDEDDAARAYDAAAKQMHGDFAWLNFPDDDE